MWNNNLKKWVYPLKDKPFFEWWIKALKSGRYKQSLEGFLCSLDEEDYSFCCLGVGCLYKKSFSFNNLQHLSIPYDISSSVRPNNLNDIFPNDYFKEFGTGLFYRILMGLNDGLSPFSLKQYKKYGITKKQYSFSEIAEYLENYIHYE